MAEPPPASSLTGVSASRRTALAQTAGYYAVIFSLGLVVASLGPTLPGLAEQSATRLSQISVLFTARSLGTLLGSLAGGRWYDRVPGHPLMAGMLLLMALVMGSLPLLPWLWALVAAMLALGLAEGVLDVGSNTLLVWVHRQRVGPLMNGLHFLFGLGAFLSPLAVARSILVTGGIQWAYWALAIVLLPVAAFLARLTSPPVRKSAAQDASGNADRTLVILLTLFLFLYVGAEVSFGGWLFTYALRRGLADAATAAYLTSGFWGAFTVGRLVGIPLAGVTRPRHILLANLVGGMAGLGLILIWPASPIALWAGAVLVGFSLASVFPTAMNLAERRVSLSGRVAGWLFAGSSAGAMTLPWLVGQMIVPVGAGALPGSLLVALALAAGVLLAILALSPPAET